MRFDILQMACLEDWSHIEKYHSSSMSAAIKALKASTLRLPVVDGAKVGMIRFSCLNCLIGSN
jgi:hypothetical protein